MKYILNLSIFALLPFSITASSKNEKEIKIEQGATKTKSGLEYKIFKNGTGNAPKKGQTVVVHYTGWLYNNGKKGKKFDSSVDRNQNFRFELGIGKVIKGWDEGLSLMKKGDKALFIIPSNLAYGSNGAGDIIPPNAKLIFEVELLNIL